MPEGVPAFFGYIDFPPTFKRSGEIWDAFSMVVVDDTFALVPTSDHTITISIINGAGVLSGTVSKPVVGGWVTFQDVSFALDPGETEPRVNIRAVAVGTEVIVNVDADRPLSIPIHCNKGAL